MSRKMEYSKKDILLVEDDKQVLDLLRSHFEKETCFNVFVAQRLETARNIVLNKHVDLMTLDIILPDGDGMHFCKQIKENPETRDVKIIVLTKKIAINDRVKSFEIGADDYLGKPFYPQELVMRVKRVLNMLDKDKTVFIFKDLVLDTKTQELTYKNKTVPLTITETGTIKHIIESGNKVKTQQLIQYLSTKKNKPLNQSAFTVSINRLKQKLINKFHKDIIKNRYGAGYYIEL